MSNRNTLVGGGSIRVMPLLKSSSFTSSTSYSNHDKNRQEFVKANIITHFGNDDMYNNLLKKLEDAQDTLNQNIEPKEGHDKLCVPSDQDVITALQQVAKMELDLGMIQEAKTRQEDILSRQLKIHSNSSGTIIPKHLSIASTMHSIGSIYTRLEDPYEAEKWLNAALNMKKELLLVNGCKYHYEIGKTLNGIALNEMMMHSVDDEYEIDALQIISMLTEAELNYTCHAEENHDEEDMSDHPDVASISENMASVYRSFGDLDMALQKYQIALQLLEQNQSPMSNQLPVSNQLQVSQLQSHEKIVNLYVHIGDCFNGLDKYDEARERYEDALDLHLKIVLESSTGDLTKTSLEAVLRHNIGKLHAKVGMFKEAMQDYEYALKLKRELGGESHPECALTLNAIGALLANQGDWQGALTHFNEAKFIYKMHADEDIEMQEMLAQIENNISLLEKQRGF
jgi:tetratricopeptide (TPR) repeat protein